MTNYFYRHSHRDFSGGDIAVHIVSGQVVELRAYSGAFSGWIANTSDRREVIIDNFAGLHHASDKQTARFMACRALGIEYREGEAE